MPAAFHFDAEVLDPRNREPGVSAMLRVRDGAQFLRPSLESCIDVFDEIIAVHHQCGDDTPQILHEYAAKHPRRFKVYEYPHEVFPPHTTAHARQPPESPHTIAALCNYALSKTTRRFVVKHDADHVYFPRFAEIAEAVRSGRFGGDVVATVGVNIARTRAGEVGAYLPIPAVGGSDFLFFPVSRDTYYTHTPSYEVLCVPPCRWVYAGFAFWHLKFLCRHYGFHRYLWRWSADDFLRYPLGRQTPVFCGNLSSGGDHGGWRQAVAEFGDNVRVAPLPEFVASFSGSDSPFIRDDPMLRQPRLENWKDVLVKRWMRPLIGQGLVRAPGFGRYCKLSDQRFLNSLLPYLKARTLARDLRGLSLPALGDLAA